jgi:DNA-binding CsgD family transcriptional regulator
MKPTRKTTAAKAAQRQATTDRRRQVATLALARVPQQDIARQLAVSEATISRDLRTVRADWGAAAVADLDTLIQQERAVLDADERRWRTQWAGWMPKQDETTGKTPPPTAEQTAGQARCYDRILAIMERRAKLLGIDKPIKVTPTDADGQPLFKNYAGIDVTRL